MNEQQLLQAYEREALHHYRQSQRSDQDNPSGHNLPSNAWEALLSMLGRIDWKRVFIWAVIVVNVLTVMYGLSKIATAYAIGGATYAVVTGGTTVFYMLFFAAFAVVMIRKYEGYTMFATVMTMLCAFVI